MKKIDEHYYLISEEEITNEMELVQEGLYVIKEDFYEIETKSNNRPHPITTRNVATHHNVNTAAKTNNTGAQSNVRIALFIIAVLFISFAVLCLYNGITLFRVYHEVDKANNSVNNSYCSDNKFSI